MSEKTRNEGDLREESHDTAGESERGQNGANLGEKIAKLDELAEWFYSSDFKLEEATERYKEATQLARETLADLAELKNEIEVLAEDFSK